MNNINSHILEKLDKKDIMIWGARMTGLGAHRFLKKHNVNVLSFIDSDQAFYGKKVNGLPVLNPSQLKNFLQTNNSFSILIAVSLKESEITTILNKLNIHDIAIYSFQNSSSPYYTVDILGSCNLKCASCPHSIENHNVPKGSMTFETFKSVFDKIINDSPATTHLSLYSWGEPLLHPKIDKIVEYVHNYDVAVALSSNLSIKFDNILSKFGSLFGHDIIYHEYIFYCFTISFNFKYLCLYL